MEKDPDEPTEATVQIRAGNLEKVANYELIDLKFKLKHKHTHGHGWWKWQLIFGIHVRESGLQECNEET